MTIYYDDDPDDTDTFLAGLARVDGVGRQHRGRGVLAAVPLGSAIIGKKIGETASYSAPNGKPINP